MYLFPELEAQVDEKADDKKQPHKPSAKEPKQQVQDSVKLKKVETTAPPVKNVKKKAISAQERALEEGRLPQVPPAPKKANVKQRGGAADGMGMPKELAEVDLSSENDEMQISDAADPSCFSETKNEKTLRSEEMGQSSRLKEKKKNEEKKSITPKTAKAATVAADAKAKK